MRELRAETKTVRFLAPEKCVLEIEDADEEQLGPGEFRLETEYSVVSVGTELANYRGVDPGVFVPGSWNEYPSTPGYGAVGRVLEVGAEEPGLPGVGERVFAFNPHSSRSVGNVTSHFVIKLDEEDDPALMTLIRVAGVSITVVRRARGAQPGAVAAVVGLGAVGNFAAQLLQLAGLEVYGFDPDPTRAEIARQVGIRHVHTEAVATDYSSAGRGRLPGGGADVVVEATGLSALAGGATALARYGGEVLLLGSPRAPLHADVTDLLRDVQLRGLTVIGASEWTLAKKSGMHPRLPTDTWSIQDNYRYLHQAFATGQLVGGPLIGRVAAPEEAPEVYRALGAGEAGAVSVVFDWQSQPATR